MPNSSSSFQEKGAGWRLEAFETSAITGVGHEKIVFLMAGSWFVPSEAAKLRDALTKALDFLETLP